MQEDLGPLEAWQIREFPRALRQEIVNEAKTRQMSPGEFATRIFLAARDAGWDGFANRQTEGSAQANGAASLRELASMARELTPPDKDSEAMRLARSLVRDRLKALRQPEKAPGPGPRMIAAPEEDKAA
jgi:hypothetical protein